MIESIVETIVGTKHTRHGARPSQLNIDHLRCVVGQCIKDDRPIRILTGWGAHKGYGQGPYQVADLLDAMALKRFAELNMAVQRTYSPGISVVTFIEDYTRRMLTGCNYYHYADSLENMINSYGYGFIHTVNESDYVNVPGYEDIIRRNADAIYAGREAAVGWIGEIDWGYYADRAASENPNMDLNDRRKLVSIFLGSILARAKCKVMPAHDLRISFVPYSKSLPDSMRRGRIEYKVKGGKHSKATTPPWTCFGVIKDGDWSTVSVKDLRHRRFSPIQAEIDGITVPALIEE